MSNYTEYDISKVTDQVLNDMDLGSFHKETKLEKAVAVRDEVIDKLSHEIWEHTGYDDFKISKWDTDKLLSQLIENLTNTNLELWYMNFENGGGVWSEEEQEYWDCMADMQRIDKAIDLLTQAQELLS